MKLLKIGSLNIPRNRWNDSLNYFDEVNVACFSRETENDNLQYVKFNEKKLLNKLLIKLINKMHRHSAFETLENLLFLEDSKS